MSDADRSSSNNSGGSHAAAAASTRIASPTSQPCTCPSADLPPPALGNDAVRVDGMCIELHVDRRQHLVLEGLERLIGHFSRNAEGSGGGGLTLTFKYGAISPTLASAVRRLLRSVDGNRDGDRDGDGDGSEAKERDGRRRHRHRHRHHLHTICMNYSIPENDETSAILNDAFFDRVCRFSLVGNFRDEGSLKLALDAMFLPGPDGRFSSAVRRFELRAIFIRHSDMVSMKEWLRHASCLDEVEVGNVSGVRESFSMLARAFDGCAGHPRLLRVSHQNGDDLSVLGERLESWSGLEELVVWGGHMGAMRGLGRLCMLKRLCFVQNSLSDNLLSGHPVDLGLVGLLLSDRCRLTDLELTSIRFEGDGYAAMFGALGVNGTLLRLHMSHFELDRASLDLLGEYVHRTTTLRTLHLPRLKSVCDRLLDECRREIVRALSDRNDTLFDLFVDEMRDVDAVAPYLARNFAGRSLLRSRSSVPLGLWPIALARLDGFSVVDASEGGMRCARADALYHVLRTGNIVGK